MLDALSPLQRHVILLMVAGALGVLGDSLHLFDLPPSLAPLAAAAITAALAYVTPLTRQYGIGSPEGPIADDVEVEGE